MRQYDSVHLVCILYTACLPQRNDKDLVHLLSVNLNRLLLPYHSLMIHPYQSKTLALEYSRTSRLFWMRVGSRSTNGTSHGWR